MNNFPLIQKDSKTLSGKPCIKEARISIEFISELVASGDIVNAYAHLIKEKVQEAIAYSSYHK